METCWCFLVAVLLCSTAALGQSSSNPQTSLVSDQPDVAAVQKIEDDLLKAERNTDPAVLDRVLADDFAGVGTNGPTPSKARLLKNWQASAGQAPPYSVEESNMHVVVRGDTAVASYTKTYTAKENGTITHQDTTDIFLRDHGVWTLRISRYTFCDH